jgi:hypothetical protein
MGAQTMSVRLSDEEVDLIQKLMALHHKLGDIPEATPSAYLKWLLVADVQRSAEEIQKRRQKITG